MSGNAIITIICTVIGFFSVGGTDRPLTQASIRTVGWVCSVAL